MTHSECQKLKELIRQLDIIHNQMFDEMQLFEVTDPRVTLVYHLANIMTPLRELARQGETSEPLEKAEAPNESHLLHDRSLDK